MKIAIFVRSGCVVRVVSDVEGVELVVIDHDTEGADQNDLVPIDLPGASEPERVYASSCHVSTNAPSVLRAAFQAEEQS